MIGGRRFEKWIRSPIFETRITRPTGGNNPKFELSKPSELAERECQLTCLLIISYAIHVLVNEELKCFIRLMHDYWQYWSYSRYTPLWNVLFREEIQFSRTDARLKIPFLEKCFSRGQRLLIPILKILKYYHVDQVFTEKIGRRHRFIRDVDNEEWVRWSSATTNFQPCENNLITSLSFSTFLVKWFARTRFWWDLILFVYGLIFPEWTPLCRK